VTGLAVAFSRLDVLRVIKGDVAHFGFERKLVGRFLILSRYADGPGDNEQKQQR
jgi:hypothetical protein